MTSTAVFDRSAWSAIEVGLPVHELEPMKRFYCEGLGFAPQGHVDLPKAHIEAFRFGDCLLKLTLFLDAEKRPKPRQPDPHAIYLTLRIADLDQTVRNCLSVGANMLVPITRVKLSETVSLCFAFFSDPMGNRIELVEGNAWSK